MGDIRVTVWNEFQHEKVNEFIGGIYPDGIHGAIAEGLRLHGFSSVRTATLDEPEHGLTEEVLAETDVSEWWGTGAQRSLRDVVERWRRVLRNGAVVCTRPLFEDFSQAEGRRAACLRGRTEERMVSNVPPLAGVRLL